MKQDENKIRKRWRYLRDQFTVELGKVQSTCSGDEAATICPKWPYFKSLVFLKGVVKPRVTTGHRHRHGTSTRKRSVLDSVDSDFEIRDTQIPNDNDFCASRNMEDSDASEPTTSMSTSKRPKESFNEKTLDMQHQKLAYLQEISQQNQNADNEHILFFKSLLPHIEKIPQYRLLSFRNRIQSIVEEFAYENQYSDVNNRSTSTTMCMSRHSTPETRSTRPATNPIAVECNESQSEQTDESLAEFYIKYEQ